MNQKKDFNRFLLLIPTFFFLGVIITSERNLNHFNDSDLNFDLLVFLGKSIFSDPFELNLLTPNRAYTSLAGNIYQFFFNKPANYTDLLMIYRIFNIVPLLLLIFYLIKKNNKELNYFLLIILMTLTIGKFHEQFINFTMKMCSVILFVYYCYILKYQKLNTIKKELSVISFFSVFLYPHTLPAVLMMTAVFKIKKISEWLSLFVINIPSILLALIIFVYQFNGEDTYNSYDPLYGSHNLYYIAWYIKQLITTFFFNLETFLGLAIFTFSLSVITFRNQNLMKKLNKYKILLFKINFFIYILYFVLTLLRIFDIKLPFHQYVEYFGIPLGFIWLVIFLSIKISNYLSKSKGQFYLNSKIFLFVLMVFYVFNFYQLYSKAQYTIDEKKYVENLEKKILENRENFLNISCKVKLSRFDTVHLRLLTDINNMRPFNITFQNPYSKLDLPKYVKYVKGYTPKDYIYDNKIPNENILKCIKK
jgi:hypothetical protein